MKSIYYLLTLFISFTFISSSSHVCSLDILYRELKEDLEDNGKLDCLRVSASTNPNETKEQAQKRVKAQWDSNCAFESEDIDGYNWAKEFLKNYSIQSLVDVDGKPNNPPYADYDDQADICEAIRALVANGFFAFGSNMDNISDQLLDAITCPGSFGQTQICALSVRSYADKQSWVMFISGQTLKIGDFPNYYKKIEVSTDSKNQNPYEKPINPTES